MLKLFFLFLATLLTSTYLEAQTKAGKEDTLQHATFYTCSMHPDVIMSQPGNCPKCGMALSLSTKEQMKARSSKVYTCPVHLDVVKHDPGKCPKCGKKLNLSLKEQMKAETAKVYTCPMHPEVALDKDGICPKCGKALVEKEIEAVH
ncbi:MAG: heavy metal-binding domain-containing protein [Flavobacterium sp.]